MVAHASVLTQGLQEHADVVFPADSYAEKEGTVVHPDGRIQRLRTAIKRPGSVRAGWSVIADVAKRVGVDLEVLTSSMAFAQLVQAVPFYAGLTLEEIGGRGVRWPEREQSVTTFPVPEQSSALPSASSTSADDGARQKDEVTAPSASDGDALRLGTFRPIWASPEVEVSPALHFAIPRQQLEIGPEDAQRLGLRSGEEVEVSCNGSALRANTLVRSGVPAGAVFLAEGIASDSANELTEPLVEVRRP